MKKRTGKKKLFWEKPSGIIEIYILLIIIGFGILLAGGLLSNYVPGKAPQSAVAPGAVCCDTGSGANCHPRTDVPTLTYNGTAYGLLKSNITIADCAKHLADSGQTF